MATKSARTWALMAMATLALNGTPAWAAEPKVAVETAHERLIPLEGAVNFRDLGGYRTKDGRTVKWGMLYRSGAMSGLTTNDFNTLASRHLRTVVDLRNTAERTQHAVTWPDGTGPVILARDYAADTGVLGAILKKPGVTASEVRANLGAAYAAIPNDFAPQFRILMNELLADQAPLAFNCSAGKDRTGVAAAVLLSVLGVPRETIMQDYLLSNAHFRPVVPSADKPMPAPFRALPPDAIQALMSVEPGYLEAAFATMDQYPGGMDGYFKEKLGLDAQKIKTLRNRYLT